MLVKVYRKFIYFYKHYGLLVAGWPSLKNCTIAVAADITTTNNNCTSVSISNNKIPTAILYILLFAELCII